MWYISQMDFGSFIQGQFHYYGGDGIVTVLALQKLVDTSPDEMVVVQAKGALWMLQRDDAKQRTSQHKRMAGCSKHVYVSYCHW